MSDLTILCVTAGEPYAHRFIDWMRRDADVLDAEFVLIEDGRDVQSDGTIESVLDEAISRCPDGYILRLDDDERMTYDMVAWLAGGAYQAADHWAFPRANLWPTEHTYVANRPLWPDLQTRLSVKALAGGRRAVHAGSPYGTGRVAPCVIEHHKFLVRTREERERLVERYEAVQPGAGRDYVMFSLPELYEDYLVCKPLAEAAASRRVPA